MRLYYIKMGVGIPVSILSHINQSCHVSTRCCSFDIERVIRLREGLKWWDDFDEVLTKYIHGQFMIYVWCMHKLHKILWKSKLNNNNGWGQIHASGPHKYCQSCLNNEISEKLAIDAHFCLFLEKFFWDTYLVISIRKNYKKVLKFHIYYFILSWDNNEKPLVISCRYVLA